MKPIINWLSTPYLFNLNSKYQLLVSFIIGTFIFLFIYSFRPFGIAKLENNLFLYCLGFGVITFIVQSFLFVVIPYFFNDFFKNERWTIGKNIIFFLFLICCISITNWYYNSLVQITNNSELLSLKKIFSYTFSIAIFPIFIYHYFTERYYRSKKESIVEINDNFKISNTNKEIKVYGDNNKENIILSSENLIYITSQKNYVSFVVETNKILEEYLLRNTLSNVSKQLEEYTNFTRCHKSYLINTHFFDSISGNSRGYFLESKSIPKKIPVSRNFPIENLKC